jgi:hypothetical protein
MKLPRHHAIATVLAALLIGTGSVRAAGEDQLPGRIGALAGHAGAAMVITPEQRLREELRVLLLDLVESGAFGQTAPDRISLSIDEPRQRVGNLGVLVDSASGERARDGLHVVGTTPGSSAERMGLRSGDVLVAVNGAALVNLGDDAEGGARAAHVLRSQVDALADGAPLAFDVRRNGRDIAVSGALASTWIPAMRLMVGDGTVLAAAHGNYDPAATGAGACGRISIFDVAPRQEQLHGASLINIDGKLAGVSGQTVFRVPAGEHVLEIGERIENRYLTINDRQRNSGRRYKTLTVNVMPDTTYFVAARLNEDKRTEWKDGAFWDPKVWKETAENCR